MLQGPGYLSAILVREPPCPSPFREGVLRDAVPKENELRPLHCTVHTPAAAADDSAGAAHNVVAARVMRELIHVCASEQGELYDDNYRYPSDQDNVSGGGDRRRSRSCTTLAPQHQRLSTCLSTLALQQSAGLLL